MTELPDARTSRAVLIGVAHYQLMSSLDAVSNNLYALANLFQDARIWGLPAGHCTLVPDPITREDILDAVTEAAGEATDTLLLYFAGPGLAHPRGGELHLALQRTDPNRLYTSMEYGQVRQALMDSRARRKIVILDCRYSGRALGQMGGSAAEAVANEIDAAGTYVLASAGENKTSVAPPGESFTAFTGELLALIEHGINGQGPLLDLDSIYLELLSLLRGKSLSRAAEAGP